MKHWLPILFCLIQMNSDRISVSELQRYADVYNTEGGQVALKLENSSQWLALHFVLDRPLIDGHTLATITSANSYPLKESSLQEYNEARVNQICLLVLTYFLDQLQPGQRMTVHLHRRSSGIIQIQTLLLPMLRAYYPEAQEFLLQADPEDYRVLVKLGSVEIILRNNYYLSSFKDYQDSRFVLSLGLVLGLNPEFKSGDFVLSEEFIPINENSKLIYLKHRYRVSNLLITEFVKIVSDLERQKKVINLIETTRAFISPNSHKVNTISLLGISDLKIVKTFQGQGLWNPQIGDPDFQLV